MVNARHDFNILIEEATKKGFLFMPRMKVGGCPNCGQKRLGMLSARGNVMVAACKCGFRQIFVHRLVEM